VNGKSMWIFGAFLTIILLMGGTVVKQQVDIAILQTEYEYISEKLDKIDSKLDQLLGKGE